ncbi:hypothetical protein RND61_24095 [Streptomyces sp. TRM76323]|uniref:Cytochrome P450 n=1 Tax=Streptomyces tamarix TaxID=3078565 RepID=A0ABU3QRU1_9ACTN|nr:hypothetical protein [Streptomyces tamarix]MDT9685117.1 hypothetical protein [Streptomyces tamarix]
MFGRGRIFEKLRPLFGNGTATTDGALHRRRRRPLQPAFRRDRLSRYAELMCREADAVAASWTPGREVRVDREMRRSALSAVAGMTFSGDVDRPAVREVHRSFPIVLEGTLVRTVMPKAFDRLPVPLNRRFTAPPPACAPSSTRSSPGAAPGSAATTTSSRCCRPAPTRRPAAR